MRREAPGNQLGRESGSSVQARQVFMAKWQTGLASGKRDATPEISSKVAEITAGRTTSQLKMEEIAQFIQKDIRYVAIEIGIGGWQPHSASDVFVHRYGDCKDKATLMSSPPSGVTSSA